MRRKLISYRGKAPQVEMAKKYNVTQQTWSNWERAVRTPTLAKAREIAKDSGIPMEELFFTADNNQW